MAWFRREQQSTRAYPNAGTSITGSASRFLGSKTTGARQAGRTAQAWEDADRADERHRRGRWSR
ncbi:hypothetical protein ACH419_39345 [Streptomyces bobili]|uniref:hypothetical protein n=1 Tax=Streptomyces bobili TaxID=67280 RepID=UPI0037BB40AC